MNYSGIRILTISPGAWPWVATPPYRRPLWSGAEGGSFPSWTLRPPRPGRPSFSCPPPPGWGGENFPLPPPRFRGRRVPRCYRTTIPIQPCAGDLSWSPRPSSWPSSPAPHRAPETPSSLREAMLDLQVVESDSQSASLSLPSPVKLAWRLRFLPQIYWRKKHLVKSLPDWRGALRCVRDPR